METERKFFVYVDFREDDGKPFYVGKGLDRRVKLEKRNPHHTNIKNKHGMVRKIVFETHSEQDAFNKEIELIQELKTYVDFGEGGANFTPGGEGGSGRKYTDEQRKKTWDNPEYKEKMSEVKKKRWEIPEHKEKMREIHRKKWEDDEYKEKQLKTKNSENCKKKTSESVKKLWEDPEHKERMRASLRRGWEKRRLRKLQQEV